MFEFKQETTGYKAKKDVSAKPLDFSKGGWQLGDLRKDFFAPHESIPGIELSAATTSTTGLKGDKPADTKPQAEDSAAPKTTAPMQEEIKAAKPELQMPEPPKAANPIIIPTAFAPTMPKGALKSEHDQARGQPSSLTTDVQDNAAYYFGKDDAGTRRARGEMKLRDQLASRDNDSNNNNRNLLELAAQEQQRQQFMRSAEYEVAMQTVDRHIRRMEGERDEQRTRLTNLRAEAAVLDQRIGTVTTGIAQTQSELDDLKDLKDKKDRHDQDVKAEAEMYETRDQIHQESFEAQANTMKIMGKDAYVTVTENGKPVIYKIDETGQKTKVDSAPISIITEDPVYILRNTDGTFKYVDHFKREVSPEKKEAIERALKATGAKPEDVIKDHFAERAKPQMILNGVTQEDIDAQTERTNASQRALEEHAAKLGFPKEDIPKLDSRIASMEEKLKKQKEELDALRNKKEQVAEDIAAAEAKIKALDKKLEESKTFKEKLQKGEFKNAQEMEAAMPTYLKDSYEQSLKERQAAQQKAAPSTAQTADAPQQTTQASAPAAEPATKTAATPAAQPALQTAAASADNGSRANGSYSEEAITVAKRAGPPFADAATGVTPAEPTPAGPTPDQILAADHTQRNQPRSSVNGLTA